MSLTDEEYWKKSSLERFNFDDDTPIQPAMNITSSDGTSAAIFYKTFQNKSVLPTDAIISKRGLDIILQDIKLPADNRNYTAEETIQKLFLGIPCVLENFRSLEQKVDLLERAVETCDGNVILRVILYLQATLNRPLLHFHLIKYKLALKQYYNYLKQENNYEELHTLYLSTGNMNSMGNLFYLACKHYTSQTRIHSELEKFSKEYGNLMSDYNRNLLQHFSNYMDWLKAHQQVSFAGPVIEQLSLLYKDHYANVHSQQVITDFSNKMRISNAQNEWINLNVMAVLQMWDQLTDIFVKPSLFKKKIKSSVSVDSILNSLYKHNAPKKTLEQFLCCVGDNERALKLGMKFECTGFVVNKLIENRDRLGLIEYKKVVPNQSEEYFNIEKNLCSDKKWRN